MLYLSQAADRVTAGSELGAGPPDGGSVGHFEVWWDLWVCAQIPAPEVCLFSRHPWDSHMPPAQLWSLGMNGRTVSHIVHHEGAVQLPKRVTTEDEGGYLK